jgi:nucleotide-binding universal stress UspA family protein
MYKHILLPTDGSPLSTAAVKAAVALARPLRARITALHVIPPFKPPAFIDGVVPMPELYSPEAYRLSTERNAQRIFAKIAARAKAARVKLDTVIATGDPAWSEIIRVAKAKRCDLIVMASHGRRGIAGVVLGSQASRVLTRSKIPVLVCR